MTRPELFERYRALPLPTTADEHWRFTDLKGFDPDAFSANGAVPAAETAAILDIDVAGLATVTEGGIEIARAPEGILFEPLAGHERLGELVGPEDKFTAHNAAMWQNGLLVVVPRGVVLEQPLYVRVSNSSDGGSLFWRLLVLAEEASSFSRVHQYASASPDVRGYSNAAVELSVVQSAKLESVSFQNLSPET